MNALQRIYFNTSQHQYLDWPLKRAPTEQNRALFY